MALTWEFKVKGGNKFIFHPNHNANQFTGKYSNVNFSWTGEEGMRVVHEILGFVLKKDEKVKATN
jgi:hypothetical protein